MAITGLVHFNVNCSDCERSRRFHAVLGFREIWRVPEQNTPEVAAAVGSFKDPDGTVLELVEDGF